MGLSITGYEASDSLGGGARHAHAVHIHVVPAHEEKPLIYIYIYISYYIYIYIYIYTMSACQQLAEAADSLGGGARHAHAFHIHVVPAHEKIIFKMPLACQHADISMSACQHRMSACQRVSIRVHPGTCSILMQADSPTGLWP